MRTRQMGFIRAVVGKSRRLRDLYMEGGGTVRGKRRFIGAVGMGLIRQKRQG